MKQRIINLKIDTYFLEQYVELRNLYTEKLLSSKVEVGGTRGWLNVSDIEVRGIAEGAILMGAIILYPNKGGEVTFFTREPNKGIGGKLLAVIEQVARDRKLGSIWAWVLIDNTIAQRVFERHNFIKEKIDKRLYNDMVKNGIVYKKNLYPL